LKRRNGKIVIAVIVFAVLILDTNTAIEGVRSGLEVCMQSAIPSLLPFLIIAKFISGNLYGLKIPIISKLGNLCGIPKGMESILGIGLISGYPVGAQIVKDAWEKHYIDQQDAERILGFCNNAGPAFIFGVCAGMFSSPRTGFLIFMIQLTSALLCGMILLGKNDGIERRISSVSTSSFVSILNAVIGSMAGICGWIICFRVILSYIERYLPMENIIVKAGIYGAFELVNGTFAIAEIPSEAIRFVMINGILGLGGLCVWMQTAAAAKGLSIKRFCMCKLLQSGVCMILAAITQSVI
jgi:hypothetical protein